MIASRKEKRIQSLLRLAELCSSEEDYRRVRYMNEVERLLFEDDLGFEVLSDSELDKLHHPTIHMFIEHCIESDFSFEGEFISDVYEKYENFCRNFNKTPESKYMLSKTIRERFGFYSKSKRSNSHHVGKSYGKVGV